MEQFLLIQGVQHVSEIASPLDPRRVSQRAFDVACAYSDFPDLPAARNIARSLGLAWADVLALAHEPESGLAQRLGRKQMHDIEDYLSAEHVAYVVRLVALRLGKRILSLSDYSTERAAMLRRDRVRWLHGGQLILPNEAQVITVMGSWEQALASAGLTAPQVERGDSSKMHAPTIPDLLERFHAHHGVQPTIRDLRTFAHANGIPFPNMSAVRFNDAVAEWKARRAAQGLPSPLAPPPPSERADYTRDVGAARPGEKRRETAHPLEACVEWMRRYLEGLPASARSTRRSYRDWARQHGAPAPKLLDTKHGGFSHVRSLAQEHMRAERQAHPSRPAA